MPRSLLHVSQGALGGAVLGHPSTEAALRHGVAEQPGWTLDVARLPPWSVASRLAALPVPGLRHLDADLADLRWLAVEAGRGRRAILRAVSARPPDVLHVNSHTAALFADEVMARVPTLLAVDAPVLDWRLMGNWRPVRRHSAAVLAPARRWEREAFARCAAVVAYSQWAAAGVRRAQPAATVHVVHPGLDLARYRPAPHRERPVPRVLFVGGRFRLKGGEDLLGCLDGAWGREATLDVVTTDAVAPRPGVTVHRLGPSDPELLDLFQQADLLCLPTLGDASPWVVVEALACGTPVVSTPVGGVPELVGTGADSAGVLVPPGDRDRLRSVLRELLAAPGELAALRGAARRRAERHFDARVQTRRLLDLAEAAAR